MMSAPPQPQPQLLSAAAPHPHSAALNNQPHALLQPMAHPATGPILIAALPNSALQLQPPPQLQPTQPQQPSGLPPPYFPSPPLPQPGVPGVAVVGSVLPSIPSIISDPSDWRSQNEAGMVMHRNGLLEQAVERLALAVHSAPPECGQPRRNLAMVKVDIGTRYKLSGNVETAMRLYEEALSVLPSFAPAYFNLAVIYSERAQYEQALKYYQLAVQHNPNYVEALCVGEDVFVVAKKGGVGEWTDVRAGDVWEDDTLMDESGEATSIVPPIVPLHDQPLYRIDCYPHRTLSSPDLSTSLIPSHSYTVSHHHLVTVQCLASPALHTHTALSHLVYYRVKGGHIAAETLVGGVGEAAFEQLWARWEALDRRDVCVAGGLYDVYVQDLWRHVGNPAMAHFGEHIVGVQVQLPPATEADTDTSATSTAPSLSPSSPASEPSALPLPDDKPPRPSPTYVPLDLTITPLPHPGTVIGLSVRSPSKRYVLSCRVLTHNCNIGVIYKNSAQLSMAIDYYEKALKANPNFHIAASNLAIALTDKGTSVKNEGRIEEGIGYYKRALHHNSKYPSSWYNLGVAYAEKGRADDAKICYEMAVLFDNKCAEAYNNLGVIYKDRGNLDQAIHYYHEALQANPAFSQTLNNLSVIYTMLGKLDEAYEYCSRAIKTNPHYAEALNNLGVLYRDEGRIEEAIQSYAECLRIDPLSKNAGQNRLLALNSLTRLDATVRAAMTGAGNKSGDVNGMPANGVSPASPTFLTSPSINPPTDHKQPTTILPSSIAAPPSSHHPATSLPAIPATPSFTATSPLSCLLPPSPAESDQHLMDAVYEAHRQWGIAFSALYERDRYTDWPECFAERDTRVLTDGGLAYLEAIEARLAAGERVLFGCYEKATGRLRYAEGKLVLSAAPSHMIAFDSQQQQRPSHKRQRVNQSVDSDSDSDMSIRVTPNHRMFAYREHSSTDFELMAASSLLSPPGADGDARVRMLTYAEAGFVLDGACSEMEQLQAKLELDESQLDAFMCVVGSWLGNGQLSQDEHALVIECDAGQGRWLEQVVEQAGLSSQHYASTECGLRITERRWVAWFADELQTSSGFHVADTDDESDSELSGYHTGSSDKHLPQWIVMQLQRRGALALLRGLQRLSASSDDGCSVIIPSLSLADQLMQILLHCGFTCLVRAQPDSCWEVSWTEPTDNKAAADGLCSPAISQQRGISAVPYCAKRDGRVWCVEVDHPDHLLIAQRAIRSPSGLVQRQYRPLVIGNCKQLKDRQLRIGYLSADFFVHSVSYFIEAPLAFRDRAAMHVTCYSNVARKDKKTSFFEKMCDTWRGVHDKNSKEVADMVRRDRIDILIELTGHTAGNRLDVMALHPAPVQMTWIGYPNTTGLPAIDYRITDSIVDPPHTTQKYTETLLRLPGPFLCYTPPPDAPPVTSTPALKNGYITFGSFNNLAKVNARVLAVWCAILHSVPFSRLLMKCKPFASPTVVAKMHAKFAAFGIPATRVDLISLLPTTTEHLDAYCAVDISVDTFPYAGTTTTCEALYMGVPVISLHKADPPLHAHNVGATLLSRIGAEPGQAGAGREAGLGPLLIASSEREYVDMAVRLCADVSRLQSIRQGMREQMLRSSLCQGRQFVEQLEQLYRKAWEAYCDKQ